MYLFDLPIFSFSIFSSQIIGMKTNFLTLLSPYHLPELARRITGPPVDPQIRPSVTDPVASIFSPGFRKKRHRVGKFSTRLPLSIRSLFCLFQTYTNDICWVCKSRTGEASKWPGKMENFTRYRGGYSFTEGKNPLGLLQRGVQM